MKRGRDAVGVGAHAEQDQNWGSLLEDQREDGHGPKGDFLAVQPEQVDHLPVGVIGHGPGVADGDSQFMLIVVFAQQRAESFITADAILRWEGGNWVEESVSVDNGYVKAASSNTDTFVLK